MTVEMRPKDDTGYVSHLILALTATIKSTLQHSHRELVLSSGVHEGQVSPQE
jgi:hypothetical protein